MIKRNGFSLVELMIVAAIIGILFAIGVGGIGGCVTTSDRESSAERNLSGYMSSLQIEGHGTCSGADSDNDGYVSCTIAKANGELQAAECGYDKRIAIMGQNTNCKVALPKVYSPAPQ